MKITDIRATAVAVSLEAPLRRVEPTGANSYEPSWKLRQTVEVGLQR